MKQYIYDGDIAWRGLLGIFVIIPVPLLLSVGVNDVTLTFQNNVLVKLEVESGSASGNLVVCGMHSTGPNGFGCRTGW